MNHLGVTLPDPYEDRKLNPCPRCGAKFPQDKRPALLTYTADQHRVVCLNCWRKGEYGRTWDQAINNWNTGKIIVEDSECESGIKKYRLEKGWRQIDLARAAGVHKSTVYESEAGRTNPSMKTLKKFASALGVSVNQLN
jgi:DNA-binding XRE family transcriptional regulator